MAIPPNPSPWGRLGAPHRPSAQHLAPGPGALDRYIRCSRILPLGHQARGYQQALPKLEMLILIIDRHRLYISYRFKSVLTRGCTGVRDETSCEYVLWNGFLKISQTCNGTKTEKQSLADVFFQKLFGERTASF